MQLKVATLLRHCPYVTNSIFFPGEGCISGDKNHGEDHTVLIVSIAVALPVGIIILAGAGLSVYRHRQTKKGRRPR